MSRKIYLILSLVMVFAFVLAACAPAATEAPAAEEPVAEEPVAEEPVAEVAEKVTVTWWHISTAEEHKAVWQKLADEYMAAHPNVNIEITVLENEAFKTKLTTVMQSGEPPDIFQSWGGGVMNEYAKAGLLKDITADLDAQERFNGVELNIYVDEGDTERAQTAQLYKTNLNRIGIAVGVHQVTSSVLEDVRTAGDDWDMYMTGWVIDYLDPDDYVLPIAVSADANGDYFLTGVNNPVADEAALAAAETTDPDARVENYTIVWQEQRKDPNMIYVGQTQYVCFYSIDLVGFMFNPVTWYNFYWYSLSEE